MRRFVFCTIVLFLCATAAAQTCNGIKSGTIFDTKGNLITLGYDQWGYNYQAHMFNGFSENYTRPATPVTEGLEKLIMKWSDDWLSNKDCFGVGAGHNAPDGKLDRGTVDGQNDLTNTSRGWVTNHYEGDYEENGELHHYTYFAKIVYGGPASGGVDPWATQRIWGVYAVIEEVYNDPNAKLHGIDRTKLVNPAGLGYWTN